ncbi:MAG: 4-(cytidine 5'-diphospho)-2-C-methyl-D-erythritol kinase [Proteobacteria bacterium]|nr:4-(cytidine 5'-diphospho)-2-C-methyl-D-erythritol kinase [Pseudomonadota bacterium]
MSGSDPQPVVKEIRAITVLAPAKVNLFLHIIGRRDDGYHLLESVFAFADFGDRITVESAAEMNFSVTGRFASVCRRAGCDGDTNIVARAAVKLRQLCGASAGATITLEKNLPLSAGLGGGSSDAAAALKVLQVLWRAEPDEARLVELALELGADVPACLVGEPCFVAGIGELITPLEIFEDISCVLVNPLKPLSTSGVFQTFAASGRAFSQPLALTPELTEDLWTLLKGTHNDLQGPALGMCDEIGKILGALEAAEGTLLTRMSGSGATCYGLYENREAAGSAARTIAAASPGWWVKACTLTAEARFLECL